jgi:hypothetical protein
MYTRRKWIFISIGTVIILVLAAFRLPERGQVATSTPGGFFSAPGTFVDSASGVEYGLFLTGRESDDTAGLGQVTIQLLGPSVSLCSAHGGSVDIGDSTDGENFSGNSPLQEIQCGTAYSQAVSIEGCTAKAELHGYSHSDFPLYIYSGSNTVELTYRKTSASSGQLNLKVYTPKGPIKLSGTVSGEVVMDTCP